MTSDQEGALSRWSRRKLQSKELNEREDERLESLDAVNDRQAVVESDLPGDPSDQAPVLTDADMPDIETLNEDSDFSIFMSPGVSDKLRNLALKKMFAAPVFNICDGLDEYDEDYTSFEALGDIVTSDMKHRIELEAQKKLDAAADDTLAINQPEEIGQEPAASDHGQDAKLQVASNEDAQLPDDMQLDDNRSSANSTVNTPDTKHHDE